MRWVNNYIIGGQHLRGKVVDRVLLSLVEGENRKELGSNTTTAAAVVVVTASLCAAKCLEALRSDGKPIGDCIAYYLFI